MSDRLRVRFPEKGHNRGTANYGSCSGSALIQRDKYSADSPEPVSRCDIVALRRVVEFIPGSWNSIPFRLRGFAITGGDIYAKRQ